MSNIIHNNNLYLPEYGDLTKLNTCLLILNTVGKSTLEHIAYNYMQLLETSGAIYEVNGDYALGIFSSGWCQFLDNASWELCKTQDNNEALQCGKWLCHECCWNEASLRSIKTKKPVDIECTGGIHLYTVPIIAGGKVVGAMNIGYGSPPTDPEKLQEISTRYQVDFNKLTQQANAYIPRSNSMINAAKSHLATSAILIGKIIEYKQVEEKLKRNNDALRRAQEAARIGSWWYNPVNQKPIWTDEMFRVFGMEPQAEVPNYDEHRKILHPDDWELFDYSVSRSINEGEGYDLELRVTYPNGKIGYVHSMCESVKNNDGVVIELVGTTQDITKRKLAEKEKEKLQYQVEHATKMQAVGTLAGGIAHEFNNMLAIIMGNNELIMEDSFQSSLAKECTEEIRIAGLRAKDVVKQLLSFSRHDGATKRKILDFKQVVKESMKLIRSSTPANIKIELNISADTYPVMGNDTQINQILINLCNNAVDAMLEKGGIITIELLNETIDERQSNSRIQLIPGRYAKLIVNDNGIGMDNVTLARVFEPYFTTKDFGNGSGIGMAVVHGIVKKHCGEIIVDSESGRGTTFTIFLPAHEGLPEQETDNQNDLPTGEECILYVDDEGSIAHLGKRRLESLGYRTESTTDPLKALEMVKTEPHRFDLVITDMAMPNMTGYQLCVEILKIRQDMPLIICTGYSANFSEIEAKKVGISSFIMKPLAKVDLATKVRKVLDGAKTPNLEKP